MLVWVAAWFAFTPAVHACTPPALVVPDGLTGAEVRLRSADAAIYGVVSSVRVLESPPVSGPPLPNFGHRFEAKVRVSRVFKGMTGRVVRVRGNTSGATCGIGELRVRQRLGLLLNGPSRPYQVSISSRITLRELLRATRGKWRRPA